MINFVTCSHRTERARRCDIDTGFRSIPAVYQCYSRCQIIIVDTIEELQAI